MMSVMAMYVATRLVHFGTVDVVISAFYFALVLAIGFYLRGRANTGERFYGRTGDDGVDRRSQLLVGQPAVAGTDGVGGVSLSVHSCHPLVLDRRGPCDVALCSRPIASTAQSLSR
jgi:hypothetical protein